MVQKKYKRRRDSIGKRIKWDLCKKFGVHASEKWHNHDPEDVVEIDSCKLLWDFTVQIDHIIDTRKLDLILSGKEENKCTIVDFAISHDIQVEQKENERVDTYQDLKRELLKLWI